MSLISSTFNKTLHSVKLLSGTSIFCFGLPSVTFLGQCNPDAIKYPFLERCKPLLPFLSSSHSYLTFHTSAKLSLYFFFTSGFFYCLSNYTQSPTLQPIAWSQCVTTINACPNLFLNLTFRKLCIKSHYILKVSHQIWGSYYYYYLLLNQVRLSLARIQKVYANLANSRTGQDIF